MAECDRFVSSIGPPRAVQQFKGQHPSSQALAATIDEIGFGPYQLASLFCCGGIMFAEGAEVLVMGSVTRLLAEQWGLGPFVKAGMTSIVFVGFAIGNLLAGYLGDRLGRRFPILASYLLIGVAGMITSAAPHPLCMALVRMFVGIGCGIGFPTVYSLTPEVCPTHLRGVTSAIMIGFMPAGEFFAAWGVFIIDPNLDGGTSSLGIATWRTLIQYSAMPAFFFFAVSVLALWESPYYLLSQGRIDDLNKTLGRMAWMNRRYDMDHDFFQSQEETAPGGVPTNLNSPRDGKQNYSWLDAVRQIFNEQYLFTTAFLVLAHFSKDFSVFGLNYVFPQYFQDDNGPMIVGVQLMLISLLAIPGVLLAVMLTQSEMIGNIKSLSLTACICGVAATGLLDCFGVPNCEYMVKFSAMAYFIVTVVYTAEVFPTSIRVTAVGICTCGGRLGSISAPLFFEISHLYSQSFNPFWWIIIMLMGSVSMLALSCLTIETKGRLLLDHDDDDVVVDDETAKLNFKITDYASNA